MLSMARPHLWRLGAFDEFGVEGTGNRPHRNVDSDDVGVLADLIWRESVGADEGERTDYIFAR